MKEGYCVRCAVFAGYGRACQFCEDVVGNENCITVTDNEDAAIEQRRKEWRAGRRTSDRTLLQGLMGAVSRYLDMRGRSYQDAARRELETAMEAIKKGELPAESTETKQEIGNVLGIPTEHLHDAEAYLSQGLP